MPSDSVKPRDNPPVLVDEVTTRNGVTLTPDTSGKLPSAQVFKLATGGDGIATDVGTTNPVPAADYSPPLVALTQSGVDLTAGVAQTVAAANTARTKISVMCSQADSASTRAKVWLALGAATPTAGNGVFLRPDGYFEERTTSAIKALTDADCRVTFIEWGI